MQILQSKTFEIDQKEDGINFTITVFNEGNYDKEMLRNVVRNRGIKIEILNKLHEEVLITKLLFKINLANEKLHHLSSSEINKQLPVKLSTHSSFQFLTYAYTLKKLLKKQSNELCVFDLELKIRGNIHSCTSDEFSGDNLEEIITSLQDDDLATWGNSKFVKFDLST